MCINISAKQINNSNNKDIINHLPAALEQKFTEAFGNFFFQTLIPATVIPRTLTETSSDSCLKSGINKYRINECFSLFFMHISNYSAVETKQDSQDVPIL